MRKQLLILMMLTMALASYSQRGVNRLDISSGILYERGLDTTLSWEHETLYHNAWEVFVNGYLRWDECVSCGHICSESFWRNYRTWSIGGAYKPCVWRTRNMYGSIRLGASVGSDTDRFLGGLHVGYEHDIALRKGWMLYWQARCDMMLPYSNDRLRTGIAVGLKIPTAK